MLVAVAVVGVICIHGRVAQSLLVLRFTNVQTGRNW